MLHYACPATMKSFSRSRCDDFGLAGSRGDLLRRGRSRSIGATACGSLHICGVASCPVWDTCRNFRLYDKSGNGRRNTLHPVVAYEHRGTSGTSCCWHGSSGCSPIAGPDDHGRRSASPRGRSVWRHTLPGPIREQRKMRARGDSPALHGIVRTNRLASPGRVLPG
jgi:hypothetical protein